MSNPLRPRNPRPNPSKKPMDAEDWGAIYGYALRPDLHALISTFQRHQPFEAGQHGISHPEFEKLNIAFRTLNARYRVFKATLRYRADPRSKYHIAKIKEQKK